MRGGRDAAVTLGLQTAAAPQGPACGAGRSSLAPPGVASSGLSLPCFGVNLHGFQYFFFLTVNPPFWGPLDLVLGLAGSPGCLELGFSGWFYHSRHSLGLQFICFKIKFNLFLVIP